MEGIAETAKLFSQSKAKSPITKSVVYDGRLSWVLSMSQVHNVLHDADTHILSTVSMLTLLLSVLSVLSEHAQVSLAFAVLYYEDMPQGKRD